MQVSKIALFCQQRILSRRLSRHNHDYLTSTEKYDCTIRHFPNNTIFTVSFILSATYLCQLSRTKPPPEEFTRHYDFSHRLHRVTLRCLCLTRQSERSITQNTDPLNRRAFTSVHQCLREKDCFPNANCYAVRHVKQNVEKAENIIDITQRNPRIITRRISPHLSVPRMRVQRTLHAEGMYPCQIPGIRHFEPANMI